MTTLADFLMARITEDEATALAATGSSWRYHLAEVPQSPGFHHGGIYADEREFDEGQTIATTVTDGFLPSGQIDEYPLDNDEALFDTSPPVLRVEDGEHIARHDPARVLAECKAKRRIVERHGNYLGAALRLRDDTLHLLALPYSDHPDYDDTWRP